MQAPNSKVKRKKRREQRAKRDKRQTWLTDNESLADTKSFYSCIRGKEKYDVRSTTLEVLEIAKYRHQIPGKRK